MKDRAIAHLTESQVGVGVKGGREALVHATQLVVDQLQDTNKVAVLQLDLANAFNLVSRRAFLRVVRLYLSRDAWLGRVHVRRRATVAVVWRPQVAQRNWSSTRRSSGSAPVRVSAWRATRGLQGPSSQVGTKSWAETLLPCVRSTAMTASLLGTTLSYSAPSTTLVVRRPSRMGYTYAWTSAKCGGPRRLMRTYAQSTRLAKRA